MRLSSIVAGTGGEDGKDAGEAWLQVLCQDQGSRKAGSDEAMPVSCVQVLQVRPAL